MSDAKSTSSAMARTVFRYAEAFAEASEQLTEQAKRVPQGKDTDHADAFDIAPMVTLDAFSVELYLKCLYLIDHGRKVRGHDFRKLYDALAAGTQASIRAMYEKRLKSEKMVPVFAKLFPRQPLGFSSMLDSSRNTFERMRYLFEGERGEGYHWPLMRMAIRDTILAIHPDWVKKK